MNYTHFAKIVAWVALGSAVINCALAYAGKLVSNPPVTFGPYMYSSVVGLTVAGVVAAAIVYVLLRKMITDRAKANRYFNVISIIVLLASFYPDIVIPWSTDPDQVGWTYGIIANLMFMHVVAAVPVMYYFTRER